MKLEEFKDILTEIFSLKIMAVLFILSNYRLDPIPSGKLRQRFKPNTFVVYL